MSSLAMRLADDEQSAWAELYDATANSLFHYVTVLAGDRDASAEILQEVFVRLFRHRDRLRNVDDLNAFVFAVTRNETNRWLSQKSRRPKSMELGEHLDRQATDSYAEDTELLQLTLQKLSAEDREIIHLKIYSELTFSQIADVLELPIGTCASRYRRTISKLRSSIQEQIG
ncbi:ECF RNA polymerase sigma factor SigL [Novipirellula aureliae]|uniref:ECF RNA polymerase sigma factor SigL n=1 Tax=Novipirellula aureliae TaxID=2527966 RepID=A0A5C6E808_9BACT|nr:sigma-70 family RNA polymerase sigma factor [Novipirellula aureliae]TWU45102.1 ECF RNA polymerase sigma factor SigL [Novipirellula aureliae]